MKAIITISHGTGSFYCEHVRYFEAVDEETLCKNALAFRDKFWNGWRIEISEIGKPENLDEFGSEFISEQNM